MPLSLKARLQFILSRFVFALIGLVLAAILLEIFLQFRPVPNRLLLNQQLIEIWESDDDLLMRLRPNQETEISAHPEFQFTVKTDAQGLRPTSSQGQTPLIVAMGDSMTFGFGVEQEAAWPSQLADMSGLAVANLGWVGWNSYVYPATIRRYAIPSEARVWVWTFFINDLVESAKAEEFILSGEGDYKSGASEGLKLSFPLSLRLLQLMMVLLDPDFRFLPDSGNQSFDNGQLQMLLSDYPWRSSDPTNADVQRGWELTQAAIDEAAELAQAHDATLMIAFAPPREYVYWPIVGAEMPDYDISQLDAVEARLAAIAAEHDLLYVNLLPAIRAVALPNNLLYFAGDGHWNEAGHIAVAEAIYAALRDFDLLSFE